LAERPTGLTSELRALLEACREVSQELALLMAEQVGWARRVLGHGDPDPGDLYAALTERMERVSEQTYRLGGVQTKLLLALTREMNERMGAEHGGRRPDA
jgi:hypothetical protein